MAQYAHLFQPITLGKVKVKNRIVLPPMVTNFGGTDGHVTEPVKDYYEARARGGAGLIITEATCVDYPRGRGPRNQMAIDDDRFLPGLIDLAQVIKKHGAAAVVQLHHAGHATKSSVTGQQPVAPSAVPRFAGDEIPRPLTMAEIKELVQRFAQSALRAKRAGFDGVEVHAAHHYLIAQFLSGAWNKREDEYGGDIRSRARFLLEVARAVRAAVGKDFMVLVRLNGEEYGIEGGTTLEETLAVARMVQEEGIDGLHISAYGQGSQAFKAPEPEIRGGLVPLAEAVKKITRVPIIAVGGLTAPLGEKTLAEGRADLVAMGRALIADPELPNKAAQGRGEDIVPCIACLECLNWVVFQRKGLRCSVNPALSHEGELLQPAAKTKRVVVIGGGPAGMEAARVAALRGHQVTLYEKGKELGGQLLSATVPPAKEDIGDLTRYLAAQLKKAKVKVVLGTEPGLRQVQSLRPEAVVIATGVSPTVPAIPGIEKAQVVMAEDALLGRAPVGERVVVLGGELVGCETADFLAAKGKKVTVTRRGPRMAVGMMPMLRRALLDRLMAKKVALLPGVRYEEVTSQGLVVTTPDGKRVTLEADTIVLAAGSRPNVALKEALEGKVPELHLIGDAASPRRIIDAMAEGAQVGKAI